MNCSAALMRDSRRSGLPSEIELSASRAESNRRQAVSGHGDFHGITGRTFSSQCAWHHQLVAILSTSCFSTTLMRVKASAWTMGASSSSSLADDCLRIYGSGRRFEAMFLRRITMMTRRMTKMTPAMIRTVVGFIR
jgi:hypothetical protein